MSDGSVLDIFGWDVNQHFGRELKGIDTLKMHVRFADSRKIQFPPDEKMSAFNFC